MPKKFFHDAVIITIPLSGHALPYAFIPEHLLVDFHLILPALIRMQDQFAIVRDFTEGILQHCSDLVEVWTLGQGITDDLTIEEVHDGGKIEFFAPSV